MPDSRGSSAAQPIPAQPIPAQPIRGLLDVRGVDQANLPPLDLQLPAALVEAVAQRAAALVAAQVATSAADRWMNVDDAAAYLACGPRRIYDLHSQRRLRSHKDGTRLLFRRSDLDAYVESTS